MSAPSPERVRALVEAPVQAIGAFVADLPAHHGTTAGGLLGGKASLPARIVLALSGADLHALEPGVAWDPHRLIGSWPLDAVSAGRNGARLVLTVPGYWTATFTPLAAGGLDVADRLCPPPSRPVAPAGHDPAASR